MTAFLTHVLLLAALSEMHTVKQYKYDEIREAANGFSDENKLGVGGFAAVYKVMNVMNQ